ncbi:uncharacterized protein LOC112349882 [Selaginella moellendorffii]|uniref:uncharacterized protein LOC112349882 n=1 Tax=Selaginella moellendorffii TaxID=88036 RepID=UPI000D1CEE32|nr:uncharacterized protein LOC112349882 [Selaginella moellendorffii]|eukprot:XP_024540832.1 uncharacterized protein LOC112349882 [Selaginella moellendorffii]
MDRLTGERRILFVHSSVFGSIFQAVCHKPQLGFLPSLMKVEEVRALGSALLVSRATVNNCSTLLSIVSAFCKRGAGSSSSVECVLEAVRCLQAFSLPILSSQGVLGKPQSDGDGSEAIYRAWLKDKFEELIELLIAIVVGTEEHRLESSRLRVASKGEEDVSDAKLGRDPYLANEKTSNCRALESSLWEIETLRRHYCPAVSRFVSTLEADLTVKSKTTEVQISDFCSGSYSTIFNETKRRLKQVPLAYYKVVPNALFSNNEEFAGWSCQ